MGAADCRHAPCKAPAVDVEHRQRPEIDGIAGELVVDDLAQRVQIAAAMMVERALGIACRARRIVQRDRIELVVGPLGLVAGIAAPENSS